MNTYHMSSDMCCVSLNDTILCSFTRMTSGNNVVIADSQMAQGISIMLLKQGTDLMGLQI